jgi:hypothetical protein
MSDYLDTGPATRAVSITPDDDTLLDRITRAVWVGGAGDLAVLMADDSAVTFVGVQAGALLPIRVKRVNATDTTATGILGLY